MPFLNNLASFTASIVYFLESLLIVIKPCVLSISLLLKLISAVSDDPITFLPLVSNKILIFLDNTGSILRLVKCGIVSAFLFMISFSDMGFFLDSANFSS